MKKVATFIVVLALIFLPSAYAADFHVSATTGTDSGTCGPILAPCKTVKQGVTNAGSGTNVVKIAAGSYSEAIFINTSVDDLTLQGGWNANFSTQNCDPNLTILQQNQNSSLHINAPAWGKSSFYISCLTFKGESDNDRQGIYLTADQGDIAFNMDRSIIDGFSGTGMHIYSDNYGTIDVIIDKSIFKNAYQPAAASPWSGGGISASAYGASQQTISLKNCLLFNNEATMGSAIDVSASGSGSTTNLALTNVTLSGNRTIGSDFGAGLKVESTNSGQTTVDVKNSIIWGNTQQGTPRDVGIFQYTSSNTTVNTHYSIIGDIDNYSAWPGTYNDHGHNLSVNPRLNSSYHLNSGSPAIDAAQCGFNTTFPFHLYVRVAPYDDIDGDARPGFGELTGCDIGADEYIDDSLCFPVKSHNDKVAVICL